MMKKQTRLFILGIMSAAAIIACAGRKIAPYSFPLQQMSLPPGGINVSETPMFVSFGADDNPYSGMEGSGGGGGMHFLTELFGSKRNPGSGDSRNFDGAIPHYSFYVNTRYIVSESAEDDPALLAQSWKEAVEQGHEIAVHTHSHPHGRDFSVDQWQREIRLCLNHLTDDASLRIPREKITGFRTPFLEYGDNTLTAVQRAGGFDYDCSIEEGFQPEADGTNFVWPYKLDHGSPGNSATYERLEIPFIREHPGLWELPVYAFIVPPDSLCEKYGVAPGLRARMKERNDYFETDQGKITGMDWNLWYEFGMDKAEFLATLKYTLDRRLEGNRCPMMVGIHSAIYADKSPENPPGATVEERKDALRQFLDYALSKPEVRVVDAQELLAWLHSPAPLPIATAQLFAQASSPQSQAVTDSTAVSRKTGKSQPALGAGFRYSVFNPKVPPDPAYFQRVANEMTAKFPNAKPEGIWIVSKVKDQGTQLSFPVEDTGDPLIFSSGGEDLNEAALKTFDKLGIRIWLQLEPAFAPVDKLIHLVMKRYSQHPCVIGMGIDVEWYRSTNPDAGDPVTDEMAQKWLAAVRTYNPNYRLFLKHWLVERMPPTVREGILFVDDSQIFPTMDPMIEEFGQWAKTFSPYPVAYQIGYPSDKPWWGKLNDPPKEIGTRILQVAPNTEAILWVDFSLLDVFPK